MLKKLNQPFSRIRRAAVCLAALLAALASGCSEPVTLYHVPGSEVYLAQGRKILILPFMDTRTFVSKEDQNGGDIGAYTRDIFVEALREFQADRVVELMAPKMPRRTRSLTNAQVAEIGRQHGADLVVAGQVFSFTGTRAASIPPRAGMFIRIINAQDGSLLFVGDHYRAAGFPGADGGRDLQAMFVSARLIEGFLSKIQPAFVASGEIAAVGALAMLSPKPARQGLLARMFKKKHVPQTAARRKMSAWHPASGTVFGNLYSSEVAGASATREKPEGGDGKDGGKRREPGNVPETERYLGMTANILFSPEQWDEQFVPEVPPLLDFEEDFYELPAPEKSMPEPLPPPAPDFDGVAVGEIAAKAEEKQETVVAEKEKTVEQPEQVAALEPSAPPVIAEQPVVAAAKAETEPVVKTEQVAKAEPETPAAPEAVQVAAAAAPEQQVVSESIDLASLERIMEQPAYGEFTLSEPMYSGPAYSDAPASVTTYSTRVFFSEVAVDPTPALVVDELPEIDMSRVYPNMVPEGMTYPPPAYRANLSGDELASDLFTTGGEVWELGPRPVRIPTPAEFGTRTASGSPALLPGQNEYGFMLDPDTLEVVPAPRQAQGTAGREQAGSAIRTSTFKTDEVAGISTAGARPAAKAKPRPERRDTSRRPPKVQSVKGTMVRAGLPEAGIPVESPIYSGVRVAEQPRTFKSVDNVLASDPYAAMQDPAALVAMPIFAKAGGARVLVLPYHERDNANNLIYNTGGGEVVTTLFGTQLASTNGITVMWDASGQATHQRLLSREEALEMGRLAGADYVVRGQVVEFRRAQSVPSFYSAIISTAMLAAQLFFAEMSGVDVATEIYRVADGMCVMSRRDRSQQKYVVQAEKTVRRMALAMSGDVSAVVGNPWPQPMEPLIDGLSPASVASDPDKE